MDKGKKLAIIIIIILLSVIKYKSSYCQNFSQNSDFKIARLKYGGGGDWYNDPSSIPNLLDFVKKETLINCTSDEIRVEIMDQELFSAPFLFMTGHGNITITEEEAKRLKIYLSNGGFLYADDDYGMDKYFRRMMKKVFPENEFVELPFEHPIYHSHFNFKDGVPKIHEHDGGPPKAFALFHQGRMVVYYTFNTNISDGWADPEVHKDPESIRQLALQMGVNIITYILTN